MRAGDESGLPGADGSAPSTGPADTDGGRDRDAEISAFADAAALPVPTPAGAPAGARSRLAALGARSKARWAAAPDNLRGSALMVGSIVVFSIMMVAIKEIGDGLPLTQTLLIRQVLLTLLILPFFTEDLRKAFATRNVPFQVMRGLFSLAAQYTYFLALLYLPLAEMTALGFSHVLFMTLTAVIVLKERVGVRRWLATGVGFVGVLIMLKPGAETLNPFALVAILSALLLCGVTVFIRLMAATESTASMLLWQSAVLCAAYLGPALVWWEWPTAKEWALLLLIGVVGTIGQYLFTMAFKVGEAAALAPLDFTRLLIAILLGYLLFSEVPDFATLIGALIVIGSTIYTVRRNARREA